MAIGHRVRPAHRLATVAAVLRAITFQCRPRIDDVLSYLAVRSWFGVAEPDNGQVSGRRAGIWASGDSVVSRSRSIGHVYI